MYIHKPIYKEKVIKYYVRYQDDFLLFHQSKGYLKECLEKLQKFLAKENLKLNRKTRIYSDKESFIFLGRKKNSNYANYRRIKGKIKRKYYLFKIGKISTNCMMSTINSFYSLDKEYTDKIIKLLVK